MITIKDAAPPRGRIKRNIASLIGGIAVSIGIFILWLLVAEELGYALTPITVGSGLLAAAAVGIWVRLADL
jgi:hypothetical protein